MGEVFIQELQLPSHQLQQVHQVQLQDLQQQMPVVETPAPSFLLPSQLIKKPPGRPKQEIKPPVGKASCYTSQQARVGLMLVHHWPNIKPTFSQHQCWMGSIKRIVLDISTTLAKYLEKSIVVVYIACFDFKKLTCSLPVQSPKN